MRHLAGALLHIELNQINENDAENGGGKSSLHIVSFFTICCDCQKVIALITFIDDAWRHATSSRRNEIP